MASIQCKQEIPEHEGLEGQQLTVGREFILVCSGDFPKDLTQEKLQFVLKPEQKYSIHLLGFEFRSPTEADVTVTAYKAGDFQFQDLQLTDGAQTLSLGPVQYSVASVLPPQTPGEQNAKQEPYGPIGPASIGVPMLYWGLLASVIGLFILLAISKVYRVVQRRNMLERLREHDSALAPLPEFHQNLRRLQRKNAVFFGQQASQAEAEEVVKETSGMLRLFLTRMYQIPALEWSDRLVLKDLKKYHPKVAHEYGTDLKRLLREYEKAQKDQSKLQSTDALKIATETRILVEKLERVQ